MQLVVEARDRHLLRPKAATVDEPALQDGNFEALLGQVAAQDQPMLARPDHHAVVHVLSH
jgi:hypothetical protein